MEATSKFEWNDPELSLCGCGRFTFCRRALRRAVSLAVGATIAEPNSLIDAGIFVPRRNRFRHPSQPKCRRNWRRRKLRYRPVQDARRRWSWCRRNSGQAGAYCLPVKSIRNGRNGWDQADVCARVGINNIFIKANQYFRAGSIASWEWVGSRPEQSLPSKKPERRLQATNARMLPKEQPIC